MNTFTCKKKSTFAKRRGKRSPFNISPEQVSFGWLSNAINPMYDSLQPTGSI